MRKEELGIGRFYNFSFFILNSSFFIKKRCLY